MTCSKIAVTVLAGLSLASCESHMSGSSAGSPAAYAVAPPIELAVAPTTYQIAPGDEIELRVMDEPDLDLERLTVDQAGAIQIPLLGSVRIGGMSPADATRLITRELGARYIRDPRVALNVMTPVVRNVSVEGQVVKAGIYPVSQDTTLESAIAMAQSPNRLARLDEVMIFRVKNGQRMVARFDLKRIRAGMDPDPQILPGDTVVVGFSAAKSLFRDFVSIFPGLASLFRKF